MMRIVRELAAECNSVAKIAFLTRLPEAAVREALGQDGAAWSDRFFGEAGEGRARQVGYDGEPDPSRAVAADLDRAGQDRLLAVALPAAAPPFLDPAYIGLVQLHRARKSVALGSKHRATQLLQHGPGRLVTSQPELALQLQRRVARRVGGDQVGGG